MLRPSRPLLVSLLIQLNPARSPLLLRRWVMRIMPSVTVVLHHAVCKKTVDVTTVARQAVLLAPALARVPVRLESFGPIRSHDIISEILLVVRRCRLCSAVAYEEGAPDKSRRSRRAGQRRPWIPTN